MTQTRVSPNLITVLEPDSAAAEAYRILRTNITMRDFEKSIKVINVISSREQEAKSTTVLNLAYVYTQLKKRVLVIDLDLRLPSIHKKLNVRNKYGVTNVVASSASFEEAVIHYMPNLDILLSGTKIPFASEFIQSKSFKRFIAKVREVYDLVIIDSPPVNLVTDGMITATVADGTILCIASNHNEKRELERCKEQLEQMNVNVLGIVMTRMPVNKKYGYSYSYGQTRKRRKNKVEDDD